MHKRLINQCLIELEIQTEGPMLIKSGAPGFEGPDMAPVLTFRDKPDSEPYIPGSSLKGVIRSHTERIARTLCWEPEAWHVGACNPFLTNAREQDWPTQGYCGAKLEQRKKGAKERGGEGDDVNPAVVYKDSCPACKVFGNTSLIGRLSAPDAYLVADSQHRLERRDGVGIDRFTGGSFKNAKFDLQAVINARFNAQLQLTNFELWQLGLLAYLLRDLKEGLIGIGSGKSRGLGQVSARIKRVKVEMASHCLPQRDEARLWGLVALEPGDNRATYGYWEHEEAGVALADAESITDPLELRTSYGLSQDNSQTALWSEVAQLASTYLSNYSIPEKMRL